MRRLFPILFVLMMFVPTVGPVVGGQYGSGSIDDGDGPVLTDDLVMTYGHGRLSRAYQDLSQWRGVAEENVSVSYLIVTVNAFVDKAKPLAQWKTEKGLNSAIVTAEDIVANYNGKDKAQKIHNYLRDFRAANPSFKWLLLLGDTQHVPVRHLWTNASNIDWYILDSVPSDFYYSALDSSWNLDGDNLWGEAGEVDWTPDVYVGRLPVDDQNQVNFNLAKTLDYEKDPFIGQWMRKALLASALYDVPNIIGNFSTRTDYGYYEWWQDNGIEGIDVVESHIPSHMKVKTLHDYNVTPEGNPPRYYGGNWSIGTDELDQTSFVGQFRNGQSVVASASHAWVNSDPPLPLDYYSHGIISYEGNGSEVVGTPNWSQKYKEFFYWTDARDITNGDMLPFWYASACLVGNFSQNPGVPEETFEAFFKNQGGGVIGLVSATHGDYRGEQNNFSVSDGDTWLLEDFFDKFFEEGEHRPGKTLYESKIAYRDHLKNDLGYSNAVMDLGFARDSLFVYNLLGEPEVPVWTALPGILKETLPTEVYTGPQEFEISVRDFTTGLPVKDATVALWGDTVYTSARTDAGGKATLQTDALAPETIDVTVTAHNYLYLKSSFDIIWKPSDLVINPANITFSSDLTKVGEDVDIQANVYNIGESPATNVLVKFFDGDPLAGGTVIGEKTVASIDMDSFETVTVIWPAKDGKNLICIEVDPDAAINEVDEFNNKACKQVEGTSKDLVIWSDYITFVGAFEREDGTPMVGNNTTAKIRIEVKNSGSTDVSFAYIRLFDGDPDSGGDRIGITDYRIDDIPASGLQDRTIDWNVSGSGMHSIYAIVDPTDGIKEFDENNNKASAKVYSDLRPTLAPIDDIELEEDDPAGAGYRAFCLFGLIDDPDNTFDTLTVSVTSNTNPNINATLNNDCMDLIPKADFFGFSLVTLTVSDGVFSVSREFKVTVTPLNDPPSITSPGKVLAHEGEPLDLTIEAIDPDGDSLTFSDNSDMFDIEASTGRIYFTPIRTDGGSHVVEVTVSDGKLEASLTFIISVDVNNRPPVLEIEEDTWTFEVGKAKRYTIKVTDPDGDPLTITDDFPHADVSLETGLAFTATKDQIGTYEVTIKVTDGFDNASKMITIKVVKASTQGTEILGGDFLLLLLLLIIIIVVIVVIVVGKKRGGKGEVKKTAEYDHLYGSDEMAKDEERRKEEEKEWARAREEKRMEREAARKARDEERQDALDKDEERTEVAISSCPNCGSPKVKEMTAGKWMCMKCGNIIDK